MRYETVSQLQGGLVMEINSLYSCIGFVIDFLKCKT